MGFARRVFFAAGVYGLLALVPQYFLERRNGGGALMGNPEYYYGFAGVALAWQIVFFLIARDPERYRPVMIAAMLEKASWGIATAVLFALGRTRAEMLGAGVIDLVLCALFAVAYLRTRPRYGDRMGT